MISEKPSGSILYLFIFILVITGFTFCVRNAPPEIVEVTWESNMEVEPPEVVFQAIISDPDDDSLHILWEIDEVEGSFLTSPRLLKVQWGPPFYSQAKTYTAKLKVDDGEFISSQYIYFTVPAQTGFVDQRDNQYYKAIRIGDQIWMAQNLNIKISSGSRCYNDLNDNCDIYGRLYDWDEALKACPAGWHLPKEHDWLTFFYLVGETPGIKLKSTTGWSENGNGTDEFGFTVLAAGRTYLDGSFGHLSRHANFWSADQKNADESWYWRFDWNGEGVYKYSGDWRIGFSVRCVKD